MLTCFFCEKSGTNVKKFTEEKLEKCRRIQAFRKKKNLLCHKDVVIPKSLQQKGYHLQCFVKFIMLKSNNKKEFASMFSNGKVLINNIPPLKIDSTAAFNRASTSVGMEIPSIDSRTCDIELKVSPLTYQMDEPSYVNPDISKGVILKSILTRKSPIKKDMTKDSLAFNSGMDLLRYGTIYNYGMVNQSNLNFGEQKLGPKIVETTNKNVCIFCGKEQRKIGIQAELSNIAKEDECKKVLAFAKEMDDRDLLEKLKHNKIISFHPLCRVEYKNKFQKITSNNCDDEDWLLIENLHTKVFEALCTFIDDKIIDKNKTFLLTDLFDRYIALLFEIQNTSTPLDIEFFNMQHLQDEIINRYHGNIKITSNNKLQKKKIVYKNGQTNFDSAFTEHERFKHENLAFELRNEIRSMNRVAGSEIPEKLLHFVNSLMKGPNAGKNSYEDSVKIKSICDNIVAKINIDD